MPFRTQCVDESYLICFACGYACRYRSWFLTKSWCQVLPNLSELIQWFRSKVDGKGSATLFILFFVGNWTLHDVTHNVGTTTRIYLVRIHNFRRCCSDNKALSSLLGPANMFTSLLEYCHRYLQVYINIFWPCSMRDRGSVLATKIVVPAAKSVWCYQYSKTLAFCIHNDEHRIGETKRKTKYIVLHTSAVLQSQVTLRERSRLR